MCNGGYDFFLIYYNDMIELGHLNLSIGIKYVMHLLTSLLIYFIFFHFGRCKVFIILINLIIIRTYVNVETIAKEH